MAKKKSRVSRVSFGGATTAKQNHVKKVEARQSDRRQRKENGENISVGGTGYGHGKRQKTDYSKFVSNMRKLQNELDENAKKIAEAKRVGRAKKNKGNKNDSKIAENVVVEG